jgi:autotransporter-associated beta strand protein
MTYNMNKASLDVWSNNISQVAIKAREQEDLAWLAGYKAQGIAYAGEYSPNVLNPDGTLNEHAFMLQGILADNYIQAITNGHPELYDKITYEDAVKWREEWMDARAAYIQNKIDNNLYTAFLVKQGFGTLIMTGDNTYEGGTTVEGGKLSINGFNTSSVDVRGGTLGGSGFVAGSIDVASGVLQPGFTPEEAEEAAHITQVAIAPGNVLNVGGDVRIGPGGRLAVTVRSDSDYTRVKAAGGLVLDGELVLDMQGPLTQGTVLTIMKGRSVTGRFDKLPENRAWQTEGYLFRVSYRNNSVTLTVMHAVPPTAPPGQNK